MNKLPGGDRDSRGPVCRVPLLSPGDPGQNAVLPADGETRHRWAPLLHGLLGSWGPREGASLAQGHSASQLQKQGSCLPGSPTPLGRAAPASAHGNAPATPLFIIRRRGAPCLTGVETGQV